MGVGLQWAVKRYKLLPTVLVLSIAMQIAAFIGVPATVLIIRWRAPPKDEHNFRRDAPMQFTWLPNPVSAIAFLTVGCVNTGLSLLLTEIDMLKLSGTVQAVAFAIPAMKAAMTGKASTGVSARKLLLDIVWLACRTSATAMLGKKLPRKSGEGFTIYADSVSLLIAAALLALVCRRRSSENSGQLDVSRIWFPACISLVLAAARPATISRRFLPDVLWTFSHYLDACSTFPQLRMIAQNGNVVEEAVSHHLAGLFFSRLFGLSFWWGIRGSWLQGNKPTGWCILLVYMVQLVLLSRFMSFYFRASWSRGLFSDIPLVLTDG